MPLIDSQGPKCPKCRRVVFNLIIEQIPKFILERYPNGLCRDCKRNERKKLVRLLK